MKASYDDSPATRADSDFAAATPEQTAALIRGRRTINRFMREAPPRDVVLRALELACWAPNHHLTQPWHFYVLGPDTQREIIRLNSEMVAAAQGESAATAKRKRWASMPGWLVVTCDLSDDPVRNREDYAACCCAVQNAMLYLHSAGIGVKWSTGAVTRAPRFYDAIWVDPDLETVVGLFWYGYPAETPDARREPAESRIVVLA